jgi:hypothetical protein
MKLSTPRWWYVRDKAPGQVRRMLLTPLSWIWAAVTANRIAKAVPADVGLPVICVPFGYTDVPIESLEPDLVIQHFSELPAAVAALGARFG